MNLVLDISWDIIQILSAADWAKWVFSAVQALLSTSHLEYSESKQMQNQLMVPSAELNKKAKPSLFRLSCRQQGTESK